MTISFTEVSTCSDLPKAIKFSYYFSAITMKAVKTLFLSKSFNKQVFLTVSVEQKRASFLLQQVGVNEANNWYGETYLV